MTTNRGPAKKGNNIGNQYLAPPVNSKRHYAELDSW